MKLEKAIEITTLEHNEPGTVSFKDYEDAVQLLIEAGKCIEVLRIIRDKRLNLTLPSETVD